MGLKLYYLASSPPSRAVQMCARQLGLELKLQTVNLFTGEELTPEFLAINLQHTVPVLDDEGFLLNESRTILRYLVDTYGKDDSLFPKDIKKRALVNQKLDFDMGTLYHAMTKTYYPIFAQKRKPTPKDLENMDTALGFMEGYLTKTRYIASDNLTIADFSVMATLSSVIAFGHNIDKFPLVNAYFERCKSEIKDYHENCGEGAGVFAAYVFGALRVLE